MPLIILLCYNGPIKKRGHISLHAYLMKGGATTILAFLLMFHWSLTMVLMCEKFEMESCKNVPINFDISVHI
jgi:hypothetical protein